jgi:sulfate transport system ATP-binding protein
VQDAPAVVYARPHEIEIERFSPGLNGIPVQLSRLLVVGPTARLELERQDTGEVLEAEMSAARARGLKLKVGETLAIVPGRMQVFLDRQRESPPRQPAKSGQEAVRQEPLPLHGTVIW